MARKRNVSNPRPPRASTPKQTAEERAIHVVIKMARLKEDFALVAQLYGLLGELLANAPEGQEPVGKGSTYTLGRAARKFAVDLRKNVEGASNV